MALIKCTECGHDVSDKASECPNCGCPIGNNEANQESVEENVFEEEPKKRKWRVWLLAAVLLGLIVGGIIMKMSRSHNEVEKENKTTVSEDETKNDEGAYRIVLYNDNEGEFYNPEGGRMCSFTLTGGRKDPMDLKLSQPLTILGQSSDRLYLTNKRLFVDYSDYLNYNSSYQPNKSLGVPVRKKGADDAVYYDVEFEKDQIEETHIPTHQFNLKNGADYTMIYYNDEHGALFNAQGERICGVTKGYSSAGDLHVNLAKSISFFGNTTKQIHLNGGYVYLSANDLIDDKYRREGEPSTKKASVKSTDDKDATIYTFFKLTKKDTGETYSDKRNGSSKWIITSVEQLQKNIVGTIWTCRPTGRTWYRLLFSKNDMTLYYAEPSSGKWFGGSQDDKWAWEATQGYTSDTGEKCYSIQIRKKNDDLSYGALLFFKDGEIQFNWLRGRQGGKAECKDYNWER